MVLFTKRVVANGDDAQRHSGTTLELNPVNETYGDSGVPWDAFQRFTNVTIPQGATIDDAKLQWHANLNRAGTTCNFTINGNDVDNAVSPTNNAEFDALVLTTATVNNNNVPAWTAGVVYDSPDLATIVQEIVDRGSWASGNAMLFVMLNNGSSAQAFRQNYSHDGDSAKAAFLVVNYTAPPPDYRPQVMIFS